MTASNLYRFESADQKLANSYGETPLPFAPQVTMQDGRTIVPQQYLDVERTLENLENVLAQISLPKHLQLFAGQEGSVVFLIVGIVGKENYPNALTRAEQDKIVYGRRWLIEPTTPTSEIVQTALLAVKKVREHELREKVCLHIDGTEFGIERRLSTTPFNNHLDLPLLVGQKAELQTPSELTVAEQCKQFKVDGMEVGLVRDMQFAGQTLAEIKLTGNSEQFPELADQTLVVSFRRASEFAHALMQTLISQCDQYAEQIVRFEGCARFSYRFNPFSLAKFSFQTRNIQSGDARFDKAFKDMSYRVDAAKAPKLSSGELGQQQRRFLSSYNDLGGYTPLESV